MFPTISPGKACELRRIICSYDLLILNNGRGSHRSDFQTCNSAGFFSLSKNSPFFGQNDRNELFYCRFQTPSVVGWGSTYYGGQEATHLRHVALPVWKNADCDKAYFQPIGNNFLCAGFADGGKDACQVYKKNKTETFGCFSD